MAGYRCQAATSSAGPVAAAFGDTASVVSGGLACVAGALLLAGLLPSFRRQLAEEEPQPDLTQV